MSQTSEALIFDRPLLRLRRARRAGSYGEFSFLKEEICDRLAERLDAIQRPFETTVDLGCHTGAMGHLLTARPDIETLVATDLSPAMVHQAPGQRDRGRGRDVPEHLRVVHRAVLGEGEHHGGRE